MSINFQRIARRQRDLYLLLSDAVIISTETQRQTDAIHDFTAAYEKMLASLQADHVKGVVDATNAADAHGQIVAQGLCNGTIEVITRGLGG